MARADIVTEVIETDVLVVGGGLGGCFAAIKARDKGAEVVVMEKANIKRSGSAGPGLDHLPAVAHEQLNGISAQEHVEARISGWVA